MVIDYFLSNRVTGWVWGYLMIGQPELHMGYITALWGCGVFPSIASLDHDGFLDRP